jgi:hydroxypyruvate isomerase
VLKELKALGYKGWVGLECRPKGSEIDAARAVKKADEW